MFIKKALKEHMKMRNEKSVLTKEVMYNKSQVGKILGCHRDTVSYYLKKGYLKGYLNGINKTYILGSDLETFLKVK